MRKFFSKKDNSYEFYQKLSEASSQFPINTWLSEQGIQYIDTGGDDIFACCPICDGDRKLGIQKQHKLFHCFRCDEGGHGEGSWVGCTGPGRATLLQFIALIEKISKFEAGKKILDNAGFSDYVKKVKPLVPTNIIPEEAISLIKCNSNHESIQMMNRRHVSHLIESSYVVVSGKYANRVILPCNWLGKRVGFEAKAISKFQKPKALYEPWFQVSQNLYSTEWDTSQEYAILTESILDSECIALNSVGLFGSFLADGQLTKLLQLRELGVKKLIFALDLDAWKKQAKMVFGKVCPFFECYTVKLSGKDPSELGPSGMQEVLQNLYPMNNEFDFLKLSMEWERKAGV